jgi:hypothetical protein
MVPEPVPLGDAEEFCGLRVTPQGARAGFEMLVGERARAPELLGDVTPVDVPGLRTQRLGWRAFHIHDGLPARPLQGLAWG